MLKLQRQRAMTNDVHSTSRTYCSSKTKRDSSRNENVIPDGDESKKFWSDIWSVGKEHNRSAEWLNNIKKDIGDNQQRELQITSDMVHRKLFEIPIWELNGKFPIIWEIFGTRNSFLGYCWQVVDP